MEFLEDYEHVDPANFVPPVPPAMNRAADLVRANNPPGMTLEEADRLVESLQAAYPERIVREFRRVLGSDQDPPEQAAAIARLATDIGLEPSPPPEPLPEIEAEDVHLVCWLAIIPEEASGGNA